jgi:hypothetical protein
MKVREIGIAVRNLLFGGNIDSLVAIGHPRMAYQYVSESRFLYRCLFPDHGLLQKPVWEAFGVEQVPAVLYGHAALEWFRPAASYTADLVSMCMLCQILKPKVIFEIGTYRGAGALHWAGNAPEAEVYTLDLPPAAAPSLAVTEGDSAHIKVHAETANMEFEGKPEARRIHCLYGDTASFDFSPFAGKVDLFFIDGSHSYEYVRNDTLKAYPCCKPGSVIAWHDYGRLGFNGVSKWLHELRGQGKEIYRIPGGSVAYARV